MEPQVEVPRVVFYPLRRGILVTDGWFCAEQLRLAVGRIGEIGWRQGASKVNRRIRQILLTATSVMVVVAMLIAAVRGLLVVALSLAVVYLPMAVFASWLGARKDPSRLQLWAQCQGGEQVLLLSSSDSTEFHKVRRALERAVEYHHEERAA